MVGFGETHEEIVQTMKGILEVPFTSSEYQDLDPL